MNWNAEKRIEDKTLKRWLLQKFAWSAAQMAKVRTVSRWLTYILTGAGLIYVILIFVYSGQQLGAVAWGEYVPATLLSLLIYLLSLLMQLFVWLRLLSSHHSVGWRDVEIYSRMILMRSLPGGIWHWVGRATMYSATTKVPVRVVVAANLLEWMMFVLAAMGLFLVTVQQQPLVSRTLGVFVISVGVVLAFRWQPSDRSSAWRLAEGGLWVLLDAVAWLLGACIVYLFVQASGGSGVGIIDVTRAWTLTGVITLVAIIVPAGLGIREASLTWLLLPYMPGVLGLLVALLIRLLFILCDTIWGVLGWGVSRYAQSLRTSADSAFLPENQQGPRVE